MTEPQRLREFLDQYNVKSDKSDVELQQIIDGARTWIGGIRWSWLVVATNYIVNGTYSAALPKSKDKWDAHEPSRAEFMATMQKNAQLEGSLNPTSPYSGGKGFWSWGAS